MSSNEELESRITALESRMDQQSGLRASQDRDLADMAESMQVANNSLIQALAITQGRNTRTLRAHTESLARIEGGIDSITVMLTILIERDNGGQA